MSFRQVLNTIYKNIKINTFNSVYLKSTCNNHNLTRLFCTPVSYEVVNEKERKILSEEVIAKVNKQIAAKEQGRLFAVVQITGKQFKITEGDIIVLEGYWPPDVGDKISLDKILMVGGMDFTLIGRPLVERGLVNIHATVIEKRLSHTKTHFRKKRRKQYKRINFYRVQQTMLRINKVQIEGELNNPPDVIETSYTQY